MANSIAVATGQATTGPAVTSLIPDTGEWTIGPSSTGQQSYLCTTCPTNAPASITYGASGVADLFKSRSDAVPIAGQETRGRSLLLKLQEVWQINDTDGVTIARFPAQAHMVLTFGLHDLITASVLAAFFQRLNGLPFRAVGDTPTIAMQRLMTGNPRYDIS